MKSVKINITPEVLTFAREKVGYSIPEIAGKVDVKIHQWEGWENGEAKPTTRQLINLAKQLERTPAFFMLDQVPEEEDVTSEFRTLKNLPLVGTDPKLIKIILEAKRNRLNIIELYDQQKKEIESIPRLKISDTGIIGEGESIRNWLDISLEQQFKFSSSSNALTGWKTILENKDIYIIQFPGVEILEARGFTLAEEIIPVIGINSKDAYTARIFTLIHELIHILLRDSVIINDDLSKYWKSNAKTEQYCNELAAEILVPSYSLKTAFNPRADLLGGVFNLAKKYRVSPYMIAIRLRNRQLINKAEFETIHQEVSSFTPREKRSAGGDPYRNQIVRKGRLLIKNAFQSYFEGNITLAELSNLTQWKVPNLNKLAAETYGWSDEANYI